LLQVVQYSMAIGCTFVAAAILMSATRGRLKSAPQ
jgi:hypothetical protein